jgi:uncharacterized protein YutE (UPF0331/DUF86 family)
MEQKQMVDRAIMTAKIGQIERCLARIQSKRPASLQLFMNDQDCQDIVIFNLIQALQGCIDLAAHIVSDEGFGMVGSTNEFFYRFQEQGLITAELTEKMVGAVGFRNLCVHEYGRVDLERVYEIAVKGLSNIREFVQMIVWKYA